MQDINSVVVTGNVTKDIGEGDFGYIGGDNGTAKLTVSIAVNRSQKVNGEWTDIPSYFDVVIWGKSAENMKKFLGKGKGICVKGELRQDRWEKDGQKKSKVYINAEVVKLCGGGKGKDSNNDSASAASDFPEDPVF